MYDAARKTAIGDVQTLSNKRAEMVAYFQKMGVLPDMICATLEVPGIEDIGLDELAQLKGMASALREGEATVEQLFVMPEKEDKAAGKGTAGLKAKVKEKAEKTAAATKEPAKEPAKEPEKKPTEPVKAAEQEQVPFPDPAKTAEPAKAAEKAPEAAKTAPQEAAGSTEKKEAGGESGMVSAIAAILRGAKNTTELDNAWRREVEGGNLEKIDKKKLAYVYQEVNVKLRNG
jgi:outer membrane biosynthesis protein TonB